MKTGIFGGSFDPVHRGHMGLAEDALAQVGLDRLILVPTRVQPFKQDAETASGQDRINMLRLASSHDRRLAVSDIELVSEGVSYTYLTMRKFQRLYPEDRLYFICGSDSFLKIDTWMNADEILRKYSMIVGCDRPGYAHEGLENAISRIRAEYATEVTVIDNRQFDVSSTSIRERIENNLSVSGLLVQDVEQYIRDKHLYGA